MKKLFSITLAVLLAWTPLHAQNGAAGLIVNNTINCATSNDGTMVGIANPLTSGSISAQSSGTLPAGLYFVEWGWYDFLGHMTLVSPEQSINVPVAGSILVDPPTSGVPAGAAGMTVYIGPTTGSETLQGMSSGNGSYTQSVPLNLTSAAPPAINSTPCRVVANDAEWPTGTGYNVALFDASGNPYPGSPMQWQLMGPGTQINVSNGLPYYHGIVMYPVPILASPLNHSTQSIAGGLSLGSYPLYTGGIVAGGAPGFTGTFVSGACTETFVGGVLTGKTGC